jgi:hypothetical protein
VKVVLVSAHGVEERVLHRLVNWLAQHREALLLIDSRCFSTIDSPFHPRQPRGEDGKDIGDNGNGDYNN